MREPRSRHDGAVALEGVETRCKWGARVFDLALTVLILPLAIPLAALVAVAIALDSPGPVLFRSMRVGRDGRLFRMVKFRTMRHLATGPPISSQDDRRYTPIGRLLAASRLDELPQLWNVLRGQMRIIGPRPEVEQFVLDQADSYRRILAVPPGITGPTQLRFADEGRLLADAGNPEQFYRCELLPRKVRLDVDYVTKGVGVGGSLLLLLTLTVPVRQLARALTGRSRRSRMRAALVLARAATLAAAVMTMVALFAVQSASAQTGEAPASDPSATSPAGAVYALPLDSARRDAAPRKRPRRRGSSRRTRAGRDGGGGESVGRGTASGGSERLSPSPIRSENNLGSSSQVPGVDLPARSARARGGEVDGGAPAGPGGSPEARLAGGRGLTPVAARSEETDGSGPSLPLILALVGLLVVVGVAAGTLAGRARRS